jgi:hypothetical protein
MFFADVVLAAKHFLRPPSAEIATVRIRTVSFASQRYAMFAPRAGCRLPFASFRKFHFPPRFLSPTPLEGSFPDDRWMSSEGASTSNSRLCGPDSRADLRESLSGSTSNACQYPNRPNK